MRARLAITIAAMRCELREVKLSDKPPAMLDASPKGTVPVLVMPGGRVVDQSLDIMTTALEANDPEGWLTRSDLPLIAANDTGFKHHLDRYKYPERHDSDPTRHRDEALEFLTRLEDRLARHAFLSGNERGLTDAAIMPFVRQFAAVDPEWFDGLAPHRLRSWLERWLVDPLFTQIMVRLAPWKAGDAPVSFPS